MASGKYDDIIHLPRPVSTRHPPMARLDRAAQFSPFAALTGYEDAIEEEARLTEEKIQLSDSQQEALNSSLQALARRIGEKPRVRLGCFEPDERKAGGAYVTRQGRVRRLDPQRGVLILEDGERIRFADILRLDGD